jgi:drug/metabolite transporter (DMT)-like permease
MKARDWFLFILLGGIWSSSFLWIKIAVQEIGPFTLVAFRVLFGLVFGIVVILITRPPMPSSVIGFLPPLVLGISNVAIPFILISWGEQSIDSAVAAILDATVPLFAIVIAHITLHDDKITIPKLLGLLIGFLGVFVLVSRDLHGSVGSLLGQAAVVLASIFYAASSVYARKVPQLPITWIALLWLGILGSGVAFVLMYYLIHAIGPSRTTMVTYLFPLGGVILGISFLGERLTWHLIAGAILIIASLAVANLKQVPRLNINTYTD